HDAPDRGLLVQKIGPLVTRRLRRYMELVKLLRGLQLTVAQLLLVGFGQLVHGRVSLHVCPAPVPRLKGRAYVERSVERRDLVEVLLQAGVPRPAIDDAPVIVRCVLSVAARQVDRTWRGRAAAPERGEPRDGDGQRGATFS